MRREEEERRRREDGRREKKDERRGRSKGGGHTEIWKKVHIVNKMHARAKKICTIHLFILIL